MHPLSTPNASCSTIPRGGHQSFALVVGCVAMVPFLRALLLMKTRSRDWAVSSSPKRVFFSTGVLPDLCPAPQPLPGFSMPAAGRYACIDGVFTRMPCRSLRIPKNSEMSCIENFSPCHPSRAAFGRGPEKISKAIQKPHGNALQRYLSHKQEVCA